MTKSRHRWFISSVLFLSAAGWSAPGLAQGFDFEEPPSRSIENFTERMTEMAGDRLRAYRETRQQLIDGWCERRLANLNSLHDHVERYQSEFSAQDLASYRQALAQERAYPCPPGGPPTPPPPPPPPSLTAPTGLKPVDEARAAGVVAEVDRLAALIDHAEAARRVGDCAVRDARIKTAREQVAAYGGLLPPDTAGQLYRAIYEVLRKPCPSAAAATPPALVQGLTQADADAVANQQGALASAERERREATGGKITVEAGLSDRQQPRTGAGVIIEPGRERFAAQTPGNVHMYDMGISFDVRMTTDSVLSFTGRLGRGNGRAAVTVAPGTPAGIVYHDRAPSGSTGINLGATGIDAILERDSEYEWFGAGYERRIAGGNGTGPEIKLGAGMRYELRRTGIESTVQSTAFSGISATANQDLVESVISLGVALALGTEIMGLGPDVDTRGGNDDEGLLFFGDTAFHIELIDSTLDSIQRNLCNVCGPADRDFTIAITDDDKRWGFGVEAEVGVGYRFKGGLEIGVKGFADYRSDVAGIKNPETGDDLFLRNQPAQIGFDDSFGWGGAVYLGFTF